MNIWNKVLLGLIILVLLPLSYFSFVALKTHNYWRSVANKIEAQLPQLRHEIEVIEFGEPDQEDKSDTLQAVRIERYKYAVDQGKIWRGCVLQGVVQGQDGSQQVRVGFAKPDKNGIPVHMVLYAFDEAPIAEGGCYLGEFKVTAVDDKEGKWITLEPTMRLLSRAIDRIKSGKGNWTLCEALPNDMHEPFAAMKEDQMRAILPASVVDEYVRDGKEGRVRQLRDYYTLLKEMDREETVLREELDANTRHEQYMQATVADAKKHELFQQDQRARLTAELTRMQTERKAALAHEESLRTELQQLEAKIAQLIQENRAIATGIAQMQEKVLRQVDRRSAVVTKQ